MVIITITLIFKAKSSSSWRHWVNLLQSVVVILSQHTQGFIFWFFFLGRCKQITKQCRDAVEYWGGSSAHFIMYQSHSRPSFVYLIETSSHREHNIQSVLRCAPHASKNKRQNIIKCVLTAVLCGTGGCIHTHVTPVLQESMQTLFHFLLIWPFTQLRSLLVTDVMHSTYRASNYISE